MKYYAVTDDPTELMHYGIKGMKWGVIRTDAQLGHPKKPKAPRTPKAAQQKESKPRSPAYSKASAKLGKIMRSGIAKAQAKWDVYNSPENKQFRAEKRAINREVRAYKRGERKFQRDVELARQGRLKYKNVSDAEVSRITDRLALERQARSLSGSEKPSLRRRVNEAVANGIVEGIGRGTSSYINERMQAKGRVAGQIKSEKRLAAYHNSLQGRLAENREFRADKRSGKHDQKVAVKKAKIQEKYDVAKKEREEARVARNEYAALLEANRNLDYANVLDDNAQTRVRGWRNSRRLSTSTMRGRVQAMQDVQKLSKDRESQRIKNLSGMIEKRYEDENGNEVVELVPAKIAQQQQPSQPQPQPQPQPQTQSSGSGKKSRDRNRNRSASDTSVSNPSSDSASSSSTLSGNGKYVLGNGKHGVYRRALPASSSAKPVSTPKPAKPSEPQRENQHEKTEVELYRERIASMLKEAEERDRQAAKREADKRYAENMKKWERERQFNEAVAKGKRREQEEALASWNSRRITREQHPDYAYQNSLGGEVLSQLRKNEHRIAVAEGTRQRATERANKEAARIARQQEVRIHGFNGYRIMPSSTDSLWNEGRSRRRRPRKGIDNLFK